MIAMELLRGHSYDPSAELAEAQREAEEAAARKSSLFDLVRTTAARKALLASLGCMFFQQLSGINAVIFYTVTIFEASGSSISPDVASIIVAIVQVAFYQCLICVDNLHFYKTFTAYFYTAPFI